MSKSSVEGILGWGRRGPDAKEDQLETVNLELDLLVDSPFQPRLGSIKRQDVEDLGSVFK
jgi:hypothetical protein